MLSPERAFDLACAAAATVCFAPLVGAFAIAIRAEDGGPSFFRQERVGRDRRSFTVLKLRTMRDGEVTRIGRWLRESGIDEMPQFLNVLSGDMRMVGPRPLTPGDLERLGWTSREFDERFSVPPGITGLAQLLGGRTAEESWRLDRRYLETRGVGLDAAIVVLSFAVNVAGKKRVREIMRAWDVSARASDGALG
jgi:lipopolysaccharide/colanic/teichoic acid biosynthesis glycosyltransferase